MICLHDRKEESLNYKTVVRNSFYRRKNIGKSKSFSEILCSFVVRRID